MSWNARITKSPNGELRLQFHEPTTTLDMDRATAKHFAALIVDAASGARVAPLDAESPPAQKPARRARPPARPAPTPSIVGQYATFAVDEPPHLDRARISAARKGCARELCCFRPLGPWAAANDTEGA